MEFFVDEAEFGTRLAIPIGVGRNVARIEAENPDEQASQNIERDYKN